MPTVADVLKRIDRIKKDLEYVRTFQDKWRDQRDRFPKIYEGILEQEKAFLRKVEDLRNLKVEDAIGADEASALAIAAAEDDPSSLKPRISPAPTPDGHAPIVGPDPTPRPDSSDEKRAAAAEIGEKLRKRNSPTPEVPTEVAAMK